MAARNAEAERFMQPLGKALKTACIEGRPWKQELNRFLLQYRTTPHTSTNVPPAEWLFNRTVKGKLPILEKQSIVNRHRAARNSEKAKQEYNKQFADNRRNVKENDIKIGDHVIVKQERKNKLTPNFNPMPYVVVERKHSRVTAKARYGHTITRNVSHFKKIPDPEQTSDEDEERQPIVQANDDDENGRRIDDEERRIRRSTRESRRPERHGQPVLWGTIRN